MPIKIRTMVWLLSLVLVIYLPTTLAILKANYEIREESSVGTFIGHLSHKISSSTNNKYSYILLNKEDSSYFSVDKETGRLVTAKRLDMEEICTDEAFSLSQDIVEESYQSSYSSCKLSFTVNILNGTDSFHNVMRVTVSVLDDDDNVCEFLPANEQTLRIKENAEIRSVFPVNSPQDNDRFQENNIKRHSIKILSENGVGSLQNFNLQVTPTNIKRKPYNLALVLIGRLDYEEAKSFDLVIEARDGNSGSPKHSCQLKVKIIVEDVNEFAPKFRLNDTEVKIFENTPISKPFYRLQAYDLDAGEQYGSVVFAINKDLARQGILEYFRVDSRTGDLFLNKPLAKMQGMNFELPLVAHNIGDTKLKDKISLKIHVEDVNDERPMITYARLDGGDQLEIEEESKKFPLDFAIVTVTDGDSGLNGIVDCQLVGENKDHFQLQLISEPSYNTAFTEESGDSIYKLSAITCFDREVASQINLIIECTDKGSPSLTNRQNISVNISDINDNNPSFLKNHYEFMVNEDSDPKRTESDYEIGRVHAVDTDVDLNAKLVYSISPESNVGNYFTIDRDSGVIHSNRNLNRETQDTFQFVVKASDQGRNEMRSSSVDVIVKVIDFNDEVPTFNQDSYEFTVTENVQIGHIVGTMTVEDGDIGLNSQLEFVLMEENKILWKIQDQKSDEMIPFKINSYYDSAEQRYKITLQVSGDIDREKLLPKEELTKSYQYDSYERDYWLRSQATMSYNFFIVAKDLGNPSLNGRAHVKIIIHDVNDKFPEFTFPTLNENSVNISRLENHGYRVARISALDSDAGENGTVTYSIENISLFMGFYDEKKQTIILESISLGFGPDPKTYFGLDESSGELNLVTQFSSSIVANNVFVIRLKASDNGDPAKTTEIDLRVFIDDSEPKILGSNGSWSYLGTSSVLNFVIIVTIIAASCLISVILMTAIFVVLRKSKSYRPPSGDHVYPTSQHEYDSKVEKYHESSNYQPYNHMVPLQAGTYARSNPMNTGYMDEVVYNSSMQNGTIIRSPTMSTYHQNQHNPTSYPTLAHDEANKIANSGHGGINSFLTPISLSHLDGNFYGNMMENDHLINVNNETRSDSTIHGQISSSLVYNTNGFSPTNMLEQNVHMKSEEIGGNSNSISADGDSGHGDSLDAIQNQSQFLRPMTDMKAIPIYFQTLTTRPHNESFNNMNC